METERKRPYKPRKKVLTPGKRTRTYLGRKKDRVVDGREKGEGSPPISLPPQSKIPDNSQHTEFDKELLNLFYEFIKNLMVQTKDLGNVVLYEYLYASQHKLLHEIFWALNHGKHHIVVLKARQMGISTLMLAIDLFWLALHPGMQGALITDTAGNLGKFREIIRQLTDSLPKKFKIRFDTSNREMLVFSNGSILDYLTAGVKESGKAVTLGTSRAYNFVHATECSNWANAAGYASLMAALSEHHPNRLFIFESTARGFNLFHEIWMSAKRDPETQHCVFIGWWAKDSYKVEGALLTKYWNGKLTEEEQESADLARKLYGVTISPQQWAWYRWKSETRMGGEGTMEAEYPTHEREAFVATGKGFFPVRTVNMDIEKILEGVNVYPLEPLTYKMGSEFIHTQLQLSNLKDCDLRVWEYPNEMGSYVLGVDPAFGRDEDNDRSVISVWRCYADKMIQVAEFASPMTETHQLAWVICHLAGTYKNCLINMEINGPGHAVKQEMDHLKQMLNNGYMDRDFTPAEKGLKNFLQQAKYYLYHRPDSMGAGYCYFWKTNSENKQTIFNQYRDLYIQNQIIIKSKPLLEEMQTIVQDGFEIRGSGRNKDDRCFATALAVKAWIEWVRQPLINQKKTHKNVAAMEEDSKSAKYNNFQRFIYEDYMKKAKQAREKQPVDWGDDSFDLGHEDAGMDVSYEGSTEEAEDIY
jgi:hypothetical protein